MFRQNPHAHLACCLVRKAPGRPHLVAVPALEERDYFLLLLTVVTNSTFLSSERFPAGSTHSSTTTSGDGGGRTRPPAVEDYRTVTASVAFLPCHRQLSESMTCILIVWTRCRFPNTVASSPLSTKKQTKKGTTIVFSFHFPLPIQASTKHTHAARRYTHHYITVEIVLCNGLDSITGV